MNALDQELHAKLSLVWKETTRTESDDNPLDLLVPPCERRYVARCIAPNFNGDWGVFDHDRTRFLSDAEVEQLSESDLRAVRKGSLN